MRAVWLVIPVLAAHIVTHAAQSQPASTQAASTASATAPSQTVMVTGCVRNDPADAPSATSVGSAAGAASSTGRFVLADAAVNAATTDASATQTPSSAPDATGATGTPRGAVGTSGAAPITSYVIHGRADELAKHVGHLVEISGTASEEPPDARADGVATAAPAGLPEQQVVPHEPHRGPVGTVAAPDEAARSTHSSVRHLAVQSVRMIAASCP